MARSAATISGSGVGLSGGAARGGGEDVRVCGAEAGLRGGDLGTSRDAGCGLPVEGVYPEFEKFAFEWCAKGRVLANLELLSRSN